MNPTAVYVLSILAAVVPTAFYVALIYWADRYEKEPLWLLATAFLWGAIPSIILAVLLNAAAQYPLNQLLSEAGSEFVTTVFLAPVIEESLKGAVLVGIFVFWRDEIDSPLDGIIYGAIVGMGFAMVENAVYFINTYSSEGLQAWESNILVRSLAFGLNHALYTSMTGFGIALARTSRRRWMRWSAPFAGWAVATAIHMVHNFSAIVGGSFVVLLFLNTWGGLAVTLLIVVWAMFQERRWIRLYLAPEVLSGTLTVQQYRTACSLGGRGRTHWRQWRRGGLASYRSSVEFYRLCSELAYKKHHHELFGDGKSHGQVVDITSELEGLTPTGS